MKVVREYNEAVVLKRAREALNILLRDTKGGPTLFMCSGGSSLQLLGAVEPHFLGKHITVTMLDDRMSEKPTDSNFGQLMESTFYREAQAAGCSFIDTRTRGASTLTSAAERLESEYRNWRAIHPQGKIIATIGVGADGHVAGIMPFPEDEAHFKEVFDNEKNWVVGYDAGTKSPLPQRITPTMPFLRMITDAVVYMSGEAKKAALARLTAEEGSLAATPARVLHDIKNVTVFTDSI